MASKFTENLEALKKSFLISKNSKETNLQNLEQIREWQNDYEKLTFQKTWLNHPSTKELRHAAVSQVSEISNRLANEEGMEERERTNLFALKKAHLFYLALLSDDIEEQKKAIEQSVQSKIEE